MQDARCNGEAMRRCILDSCWSRRGAGARACVRDRRILPSLPTAAGRWPSPQAFHTHGSTPFTLCWRMCARRPLPSSHMIESPWVGREKKKALRRLADTLAQRRSARLRHIKDCIPFGARMAPSSDSTARL
eukprot:164019-Chlamydomonas_euryale.AAC.1